MNEQKGNFIQIENSSHIEELHSFYDESSGEESSAAIEDVKKERIVYKVMRLEKIKELESEGETAVKQGEIEKAILIYKKLIFFDHLSKKQLKFRLPILLYSGLSLY